MLANRAHGRDLIKMDAERAGHCPGFFVFVGVR